MNEDSDAVASRPDPATAWRSLCEQLGALGDEAAAIDPAVGVRHLARLVALALEEQPSTPTRATRASSATRRRGANGARRTPTTSTSAPR